MLEDGRCPDCRNPRHNRWLDTHVQHVLERSRPDSPAPFQGRICANGSRQGSACRPPTACPIHQIGRHLGDRHDRMRPGRVRNPGRSASIEDADCLPSPPWPENRGRRGQAAVHPRAGRDGEIGRPRGAGPAPVPRGSFAHSGSMPVYGCGSHAADGAPSSSAGGGLHRPRGRDSDVCVSGMSKASFDPWAQARCR